VHPGNTSVVLDSNGAGVATIQHLHTGFFWRIYQVTVQSSAPALTVQLRLNEKPLTSQVTAASPVAASHEPYVEIGDHDAMTVVVSNGGSGSTITVSYYYDELAGQS
jgi:hypothetical protein